MESSSMSIDVMHLDMTTEDESPIEPSRQDILARAQAIGRRTWASIADVRVDPLLEAKLSPRVASRRATLRNVVYATLGVCIACSVAALASGSEPTTDGARRASIAVTPVESLDSAAREKASPSKRAVGAIPKAPTLRHRR
jgi:hypothetical protein